MFKINRASSISSRAKRKATMWCPHCDVTWWGTTSDTCWSCQQQTATTSAPKAAVRVLTVSPTAD